MRYYEIEITDPTGKADPLKFTSWVENPAFPGSIFGSRSDLGALNVNFDFQVVPYSTPRGASMVEIWGIDLETISQANNLNNRSIKISAGFKPGLPLATYASQYQSGPILLGFILQAYGNWIGTNMTLNLVISPGSPPTTTTTAATAAQTSSTTTARPPTGTLNQPINGNFSMPAGVKVSTAVRNFLSAALPSFTITSININPDFSLSYPQAGVYLTLNQFNEWINRFSRGIVGGNYGGINIRIEQGNQIVVYDNNGLPNNIELSFVDLIGQPTWIAPFTIQFKCPMRADLQVGYTVTMPPGFYNILPNQPGGPGIMPNRSRTAQQGKTIITELRHVGNFRQPDANSWVTVATCAFLPQPA
jgi:hypothetical protein